MRPSVWFFFLPLAVGCLWGQTLKLRPTSPADPPTASGAPLPIPSIPLTLPAGTPLKVVVDEEVRVRKVGEPICGKTAEPIYAFDKLLVPAGSQVLGKIVQIDPLSKKVRTMAAMNADFSPNKKVTVEFNELVLPDGQRLPIHTAVTPGSGGVLQFVPASDTQGQGKLAQGRKAAKGKLAQTRQDIHRQLQTVKDQIHSPNKMHRLKRLALAQSPYHPQYLDAGTSFNADVQEPISFGSEQLKPESLTNIGTQPPTGSVVHAWLSTPLNSGTTRKGDPVEAVISQPLVVSDHLFLPQGSRIRGSVLQVRPARRFGRNGQLRIAFHEVVPPHGVQEKVEAALEGLEVAKRENLKLDSEGGAQVTTPKTRYLTTGIAVMLAASSAAPDADRFRHGTGGGGGGGDIAGGTANGASGFKLVGALVSAFARSRVVAAGFGSYGAVMSIYSHFLARGRDVVYPKDMSMMLALGSREKPPASTAGAKSLSETSGHPPGN
jgi:hypothetical protein